MASTIATSPVTPFSRDVMGRYVCNGLDEALESADRGRRPDARPFDTIIIGGGTFGCVLAQELFARDAARRHRILVLEGGPLLLPEHVQNLPLQGLDVAGATSIADLRAAGQFGGPRNEVWGLAWHADHKFPGLAYCVGGRSLYWGGWSPRPLASELPEDRWPGAAVAELTAPDGLFDQAARQIGVDQTNDFISGHLHEALRRQVFEGIGTIPGAVPLDELPLHLAPDALPEAALEDELKLEAPLAVQSRTRSGFFPFNKFSGVPLLMRAARSAWSESAHDNVLKRLMIVPHCHVTRLALWGDRVGEVQTNLGNIGVPPGGRVILALATIESTRLALLSFGGVPHYGLIGHNLMAHLRSNLTIRIPREALRSLPPAVRDLQASALFVKGRHGAGHFHLQITAAGLGARGGNSEAELFKKIPDLDGFDHFAMASDTHVVITIRGIGEMEPQNPDSAVALDPEPDEFGVPRAFVRIRASAGDLALWTAMDRASDAAALVFAGGREFEILTPRGAVRAGPTDDLAALLPYRPAAEGGRRDGLGTTHHETGTLWMGDRSETSVTRADCRLHAVTNAYVAGPALFPTIGSPNPMLTGVALCRRLARVLVPDFAPYAPPPTERADGFAALFDGADTGHWHVAGRGGLAVVDGALAGQPGSNLGLIWCDRPLPADFELRLEWMRQRHDDNSGVFVRFPDPRTKGYDNPAYVPVHFGYEVQIDETGTPARRRTGAIYDEIDQDLSQVAARPPGEWNLYEIRVAGQVYEVRLNGTRVTRFQNAKPDRGLPTTPAAPSYMGLQIYPGSRVLFRNIRCVDLAPTAPPLPPVETTVRRAPARPSR